MEIFFNECSLHEQFHDKASFEKAIRVFFSVFNTLNKKKVERKLYWDKDTFLIYSVIKNELFVASLNKISDKSLQKAVINMLYNKLNIKDWKLVRIHSADDWFECENELVTDTSLAELAERQLRNVVLLGLLVNFPESKFSDKKTIDVIKNGNKTSTITLDCIGNRKELEDWFATNLQFKEYDINSNIPPTDAETVLRDASQFQKTKFVEQGRYVYEELETGYYWYVDNLHYGRSAHLEVFDTRGRHVGESNLIGEIDTSKQKKERQFIPS